MAKTSQELEKEFIDGLKENSGKDLTAWMKAIDTCEIDKRNDIIKWLKTEHKFRHLHASLLIGIHKNNGKPVYGSEDNLLENQISKYPDMRPLFEEISEKITSSVPDTNVIVKKTYVSYNLKREFAALNIKKDELRLGLDLGDTPFAGKIEKAKLTGPMARISHMVVLKSVEDFDDEVISLIHKSNERVNL